MNLVDYIQERLYETNPIFQWKLLIDTKKKTLELFGTFQIETETEVHVQDDYGQKNDEDYIQFEDSIIFYDPEISLVNTENYLYALPISIEQGVEKGLVNNLLNQMNRVYNAGRSELREFLRDPGLTTFELSWHENSYLQSLELLKETGRYNTEILSIDFDQEKTALDELKGNTDDSVERI